MKKQVYLLILFIIFGCSSNNSAYWCGDHACANKAEKESYFKKTMIVEIRNLKKENKNNDLGLEKIIERAEIKKKTKFNKEKKLSKQLKFEEKQKKKKEKSLLKQARINDKKRLKEEKILAKQIKLEEKKRKKKENKLAKLTKHNEEKVIENKKKSKTKKIKDDYTAVVASISSNSFKELVESIIIKNTFKPYPDINDIPN